MEVADCRVSSVSVECGGVADTLLKQEGLQLAEASFLEW